MLSLTALTASYRSLCISTISALSIATSVPAPIAIPVSADASAGASLTPSPIIATLCPAALSFAISASFSSGSTPAITLSIPTCSFMALAVTSLSPVNITTSMPIFLNSLIAALELSFTTSATAIIPITLSVSANISGVLPFLEYLSATFLILSLR